MTDSKKSYQRKWVLVSAVWGNDDVEAEIKMSPLQWEKIINGEKYESSCRYWNEGQKFTAYWKFNHSGNESVLVEYDDGGTGLDGTIEDLYVTLPE